MGTELIRCGSITCNKSLELQLCPKRNFAFLILKIKLQHGARFYSES